MAKPPEKPPSVAVTLHLVIENFSKNGRGRKPAREQIEAMLERHFAMQKTGNCDYQIVVPYDTDPEGSDLDNEINALYSYMANIAESHRCSLEADIYEAGGEGRSW